MYLLITTDKRSDSEASFDMFITLTFYIKSYGLPACTRYQRNEEKNNQECIKNKTENGANLHKNKEKLPTMH